MHEDGIRRKEKGRKGRRECRRGSEERQGRVR